MGIVDARLFEATYATFVSLLQDNHYELRSSRLHAGRWTVHVTPRPLLTIRTMYDGHTQVLTVHSRRLLTYVERYRSAVAVEHMVDVASAAVAVHDDAAGR